MLKKIYIPSMHQIDSKENIIIDVNHQ